MIYSRKEAFDTVVIFPMEILVGGLAAASAGAFTNPLEVLKIRMQLQGELQKKGQHAVHYKNIFHASYVIVKNEGVMALQKGLVPALWVQFIMNGFRFGTFHSFNYVFFSLSFTLQVHTIMPTLMAI